MTQDLFHLAVPEEWAEATAIGAYEFSTRGLSVEQVGFVHCSYGHQLAGVASRFYGDCPQVLVLVLNAEVLASHGLRIVKEPAAENATELFPHLFGPIPLDAVSEVRPWNREAEGGFTDPPIHRSARP
jgi:glutathione S-transferase